MTKVRGDRGERVEGALRALAAVAPLGIMLVGARVLWGDAPWGVVLNGAELGLLSAMIAVGLALTYRANRIINFAQADLGIVPALLALLLILAKGWSIWLALPLGLLASAVLGALVEMIFVRRFFKAPRLILTVATIGVAQILVAVSLFMPGWFGNLETDKPPAFVNVDFTFDQVAFNGHDVGVFVIVPMVLLALAIFMRNSSIGVGLRGSAESANRALLLGVPVKRLHTVVWIISSLLAFTGLFLRAGVVGVSIGRVLGPTVLLPALGAAVIGRMERMPTIVSAAVGLGIVSQSVRYSWNQDAYRDVVIAVIIVAALLFVRARGPGRVADVEMSTWQANRETRPIPAELRRVTEVRVVQWVLAVIGLAGLVAIPIYLGESRVLLAGTIGIFAIIGVSLVVLTGWGGQVSLGQVAVVGLAGAAAGSVTTRYHWDLSLALLVGGVAGALVMTAVGLPTLRARGLTFAVTTLALALVTSSYLLNPAFFSSWLPEGRIQRTHIFGSVSVESETRYYILILVMLAFALFAARGLRTTRTGRVLIGTRENERAAQSYGIDARRAVLIAFVFSGFVSGVAGALFVHQQRGHRPGQLRARGRPAGVLDGRRRRARLDGRGDRGRDLRVGDRLVPPARVVVPCDGCGHAARAHGPARRPRRRDG